MPKYTVGNPPPRRCEFYATHIYNILRTVHSARCGKSAQVSDLWDVREGEGLNEEDLDQLLKGRSDRIVFH
jgi:hypothetical protein